MSRKKNPSRNTMHYKLVVWFTGLLTAIILFFSGSIVVLTTVELYESIKTQVDVLGETIEATDTDYQKEWIELLRNYTSGDASPYYMRVDFDSGETIYSSEAQELFAGFREFKQLFFLDTVLWTNDFDPYYFVELKKEDATVMILVDIEDYFSIVERIISVTIMLTLLLLLVGSFAIYQFAKKFSQPLEQMNQEIGQLGLNEDELLSEPKSPQEVQNVSRSFNQLLEKQREALEREQQFVADASHELRTPLAAIRGHVNLINRRGKEHPEVIPKSIGFIDTESKRMEKMVEQLLILGKKGQSKQEVNLSKVVEQTLEELRIMMAQSLVSDISKDVIVIGSKEHFHQIVRNLVENAMKYTEKDGEISVFLKQEQNQIQLIVADNGIGISAEDKRRVFDRFYRADQSRSSKIAGSGIGLSIVKELIGQTGGSIKVLDNQPKGSQFIVILPVPHHNSKKKV